MKSGIGKENNWVAVENGQTIGTIGCEGGKIIVDIEHINGARITLEKDCGNIPFAITLGVYGLLFHTQYENDLSAAEAYIELKKVQIEMVFEHYEISIENRDDTWNQKHDVLIDAIAAN